MFYLFFVFITLFGYSTSQINSETSGFQNISDQTSVIFSLEDYDVSNPDGESIESYYSLAPLGIYKIVVTKIPSNVHFVIVQVHSYLQQVILSYDGMPLPSTSVTGTNIGLLKSNLGTDLSFYLTYNSSDENVDVMIATQAYGIDAPIPGGCNMEFPVEVSPFLQTTYNNDITQVDFAPSAPPFSLLKNLVLLPNDECNIKPSPVEHKLYHKYFPERDFSKETYFDVLKSMMTRSRIIENGVFVKEKLTGSLVRRFFASYPGIGNAFVVLSEFGNQTAVYVPSFTYACNNSPNNNTCMLLTTTLSKLLWPGVLVLGLYLCLFGTFFHKVRDFIFGFLVIALIVNIILSVSLSNFIASPVAGACGLTFALFKLLVCSRFCSPVIFDTFASLTTGFIVASIIFFSITDSVDLMVSDINFWGIFFAIVTACPILMLCWPKKSNIINCGFVGSYIAMTSIDQYIGTNLRYIVINIIRRAAVGNFNLAVIAPPFQWKDYTLCLGWALLMVLGISIQLKFFSLKKTSNNPTERSPLLLPSSVYA